MMSSSRSLVLAQVAAVKDQNVIYPSCKYCYSKVYSHGEGEELVWKCIKCKTQFPECDINYRFRIHLMITDDSTFCDVSVFGRNSEQLFGCTAYQFKRYLDQNNDETASLLSAALDEVFVGRFFLFGFKSGPVQKEKCLTELNLPVSLCDVLRYALPKPNISQYKNKNAPSLVAYQMLPAPERGGQTQMPTVLKTLRSKIQDKIRHLGGDVVCSNPGEDKAHLSILKNSFRHELFHPITIDTPVFGANLGNNFAQCNGQKSVLLSCDKDSSSFLENQNHNSVHFESYLQAPLAKRFSSFSCKDIVPGHLNHSTFHLSKTTDMVSTPTSITYNGRFSDIDFESSFSEASADTSTLDNTDCLEDESYSFPIKRLITNKNDDIEEKEKYFTKRNHLSLSSKMAHYESLEIPRSDSSSGKTGTMSGESDTASQGYLELPDETWADCTEGSVHTCVLDKLSLGLTRSSTGQSFLPSILHGNMRPTELSVLNDCDDEMLDETFDPSEPPVPCDEGRGMHEVISKDPRGSAECFKKFASNAHGYKQTWNDADSNPVTSPRREESLDNSSHTDSGSISDSDSFLLLACQAVPTQEKSTNVSPDYPLSSNQSISESGKSSDEMSNHQRMKDSRKINCGNQISTCYVKEGECVENDADEHDKLLETEPGLDSLHETLDDHEETVDEAASSSTTTENISIGAEEMPYSEDLDAFLNDMSFSEELQFQEEGGVEKKIEIIDQDVQSTSQHDLGHETHANQIITKQGLLEIPETDTNQVILANDLENVKKTVKSVDKTFECKIQMICDRSSPVEALETVLEGHAESSDIPSSNDTPSEIRTVPDRGMVLTVDESYGNESTTSASINNNQPLEESQECDKDVKESSMLPMSEELFGTPDLFGTQYEICEDEHIVSPLAELSQSACLFSSASELFSSSFSSQQNDDCDDGNPVDGLIPRTSPPSECNFRSTVLCGRNKSDGPSSLERKSTASSPGCFKVPGNVSVFQAGRRRKSVHFAGVLVESENIPQIDRQMRDKPLPVGEKSRRRSCLVLTDTPGPLQVSSPSTLSSQADLFSPSPEVCRLRQNLANLTLHSTPVHEATDYNEPLDVINESIDWSPQSDFVPTSTKPNNRFKSKFTRANHWKGPSCFKDSLPIINKMLPANEDEENFTDRISNRRPININMLSSRGECVMDYDKKSDSDDSNSFVASSQDLIIAPKLFKCRTQNASMKDAGLSTRNFETNNHSADVHGSYKDPNDDSSSSNSQELFSASGELFSDSSWASGINDSLCKKLF